MILSLNTSTKTFSAALSDENGECLKDVSVNYPDGRINHSEIILQKVKLILNGRHPANAKISKVACIIGPGSFTGIRIGLTFARLLCQYYLIPLIGIKTHMALAQRLRLYLKKPGIFCPIIPASLNDVYVSIFVSDNACLKEISSCKVVAADHLKKYVCGIQKRGNLFFTGDWAANNSGFLQKIGITGSEIIENNLMPSVACAAATLVPHLPEKNFSKVVPFYIQPPRLR